MDNRHKNYIIHNIDEAVSLGNDYELSLITDKFISWKTKFDYSKTSFKYLTDRVKIICPIHGEFNIAARRHLSAKKGCRKCLDITTEEFIKRSKEKHGNIYDYSKSIYKSTNDKIKIICKTHGEFTPKAGSHMRGTRCKRCIMEINGIGWNEKFYFSPIIYDVFSTFKIESQYPISLNGDGRYNYYIDFVIPDLNIAVEYDEAAHYTKKRKILDIKRQKLIEQATGVKFIRVDDGKFMKEGKEYFLNVLKENNIAIEKE